MYGSDQCEVITTCPLPFYHVNMVVVDLAGVAHLFAITILYRTMEAMHRPNSE